MKKILSIFSLLLLSGCFSNNAYDPDYNYLAAHVNVVGQTSQYVVYEYLDVRIDEIAPIAAIYCNDKGGRTAELYDIGLAKDHRRRATFVCR